LVEDQPAPPHHPNARTVVDGGMRRPDGSDYIAVAVYLFIFSDPLFFLFLVFVYLVLGFESLILILRFVGLLFDDFSSVCSLFLVFLFLFYF
jgi:hypothetical protein